MLANLFEKLNKKYRIAFIDHESLSQNRLLVIKPMSILLAIAGVLVIVALGTASLVIFSPINKIIPGAPDPELDAKFLRMSAALDSAEVELEAKDKWIAIMQQAASSGVNPENRPPALANDNVQPLEDVVEEAENNNDNINPQLPPQAIASPPEMTPPPIEGSRFNLFTPVDGYVSNEFSYNEDHYGVDVVARENAPIKAVASGFVIFSEYSDETGYVIGISHGEDLFSFYKHNSMVFKEVGDYVFGGEAIAVIGNSGQNSSGTHLHFELWHKGQARDPLDYMVFN